MPESVLWYQSEKNILLFAITDFGIGVTDSKHGNVRVGSWLSICTTHFYRHVNNTVNSFGAVFDEDRSDCQFHRLITTFVDRVHLQRKVHPFTIGLKHLNDWPIAAAHRNRFNRSAETKNTYNLSLSIYWLPFSKMIILICSWSYSDLDQWLGYISIMARLISCEYNYLEPWYFGTTVLRLRIGEP